MMTGEKQTFSAPPNEQVDLAAQLGLINEQPVPVPGYTQRSELPIQEDINAGLPGNSPPAYTTNLKTTVQDSYANYSDVVSKQSSWYHGVRYSVDELWKAALQRNVGMIQKCLKAGLSVNHCRWVRDATFGRGVRSIADIIAGRNDIAAMRLLLEYNVDLTGAVVSVFANNRRSEAAALFWSGELETLEDDLWTTPLHEACKNGHLDMIGLLLDEAKVNPHTMDNRQRTGLFIATKSKQVAVVERLMRSGVAIESENAGGVTPLANAAYAGSSDIVDLLLASGARVDAADDRGETALYNASLVGNHEIIAKLVAYGADIDARNLACISPFFRAASRFKADTMDFLVECGADTDVPDANGCTALLRAVMAKNFALIRYLLAHGADIDKADDRGWTPIFAAMIHRDDILIRLLLDSGCDVFRPDLHGNTPLHQAAMLNSNITVRHILSHYSTVLINTSQMNLFGETPLILACKYNNTSIVKILLKHGANPNFTDRDGHTALDRAMYHANYACVKHLLSAEASINDTALRSLQAGYLDRTGSNHPATTDKYSIIRQLLLDKYKVSISMFPKVAPSPQLRESFALAITVDELRVRMRAKQRKPITINPETGATNQSTLRENDLADPFEVCIPKVPMSQQAFQSGESTSGSAANVASTARVGVGVANMALNVASFATGI